VYGPRGRVIGLVSVGITLRRLSAVIGREVPRFVVIALCAFAVVGLSSWAVSRRLRKQTLGLGPQEITRLYQHHDAVLHAMHEGLLVLDSRRRVLLANDEAVRLRAHPRLRRHRPPRAVLHLGGISAKPGAVLSPAQC
jgi:two-component system, CitB family, sensor kinase